MQQQKSSYQAQRQHFMDLVQYTIEGLSKFEPSVIGLEPKDCVFRINRDIRFSKDKTLYKTHFGAYMAAGGRKSMLPGFYLHLEPGNKTMVAGGLYRPDSKLLKKVRQEIDYNGQDLRQILKKANWQKHFGPLQGERLTRSPKGYDIDHPDIDLLQLKSFLAVKKYRDSEVSAGDFPKQALITFKKMHPLIQFLNRALD